MSEKAKQIMVGADRYVLESEIKNQSKQSAEGLRFVIIRTYSAGVHMGFLKSKSYTSAGTIVELVNSRRIYRWSGAMTLSQLAMEGSKKITECQITMEVDNIELNAIEVIGVTEVAFENLNSAKIWKI